MGQIKVYLLLTIGISLPLVVLIYYRQFQCKCEYEKEQERDILLVTMTPDKEPEPVISTVAMAPDKEPEPAVERKCISFTIYQVSEDPVSPIYTDGFLLNVDLARILFPGWKIYLYLDTRLKGSAVHNITTSVHSDIVTIVWKTSNVAHSTHFGHIWRFLVADNEECDRWIVRDTDDRMSIRTLQAVLDWIWSGRSFHIMRDHPLHDGPILAGLFGGVKGCLGDGVKMEDLLAEYFSKLESKPDDFNSDQNFLAQAVFPRIRKSFLVHDDYLNQHQTCKNYGNCKRFPVPDAPFIPKWSQYETLDCSCKTCCIYKDGVCPLNNNNSLPVCKKN